MAYWNNDLTESTPIIWFKILMDLMDPSGVCQIQPHFYWLIYIFEAWIFLLQRINDTHSPALLW